MSAGGGVHKQTYTNVHTHHARARPRKENPSAAERARGTRSRSESIFVCEPGRNPGGMLGKEGYADGTAAS